MAGKFLQIDKRFMFEMKSVFEKVQMKKDIDIEYFKYKVIN